MSRVENRFGNENYKKIKCLKSIISLSFKSRVQWYLMWDKMTIYENVKSAWALSCLILKRDDESFHPHPCSLRWTGWLPALVFPTRSEDRGAWVTRRPREGRKCLWELPSSWNNKVMKATQFYRNDRSWVSPLFITFPVPTQFTPLPCLIFVAMCLLTSPRFSLWFL